MRKKVQKDINSYKQKVFMGFTLRQVITFLIAGAIGAPIYYFTYKSIGTTNAGWLVFLLLIPIIILGIIPFNGMMAEQYLLVLLRNSGKRNIRLYKNEEMRVENVQSVQKKGK